MIFGMGTGRCGTKSLATLLGLTHEATSLPWVTDYQAYAKALEKVRPNGGDVGCYWLRYVPYLTTDLYDPKFVCLKRDRESTAQSWARQMSRYPHFALAAVGVRVETVLPEQNLFPDLRHIEDKVEAAGRYWDLYYQHAEGYERLWPKRFRIFDMDAVLNTSKGQREMLDFLGSTRPTSLGHHENRHDPVLEEGRAMARGPLHDDAQGLVAEGVRAIQAFKGGSSWAGF